MGRTAGAGPRILAGLLLVLPWLLPGCAGPARPGGASPSVAEWTLLFYGDADNDLEESSMDDLRELLKVGGSPRVHLVMLSDRSPEDSLTPGYSNERVFNLPAWSSTLLLELGREEARVVADWGEQNLADGETLRRFLDEAGRRYPARRYGLVLCDHGNGWSGLCSDDSAGEEDVLTVDEMAAALEASKASYGGRLELLGFDACLMASVEVAAAAKPWARIMVASEELEPSSGWDYVPLVRALEERPELDGAALGKLAVQSFRRSFENSPSLDVRNEGRGTTLSVIDLDRLDPVLAALEELGRAGLDGLAGGDRRCWLTLARARSRSEQYGSEGTPEDPGVSALDLGDFAARVHRSAREAGLREAAARMGPALREAVIARFHGEVRPEASGLSVFFPADRETLEGFAPADYGKLPGLPGPWRELVRRYVAMVQPAKGEPLLADLSAGGRRLLPGRDTVELSGEVLAPDELESAWFVVLSREGGDRVVVGQEPLEVEDGALAVEWDGSLLALGTEESEILLPLSSTDGPLSLARAELRQGTGAWQQVQLHLDEGKLLYATVQGSGGHRLVKIGAGDRLRAVHLVFDEDDLATTASYEDEVLVVKDPKDLALYDLDLPEGDYEAGFLLYDFDGERDLQTVPVRILEEPQAGGGRGPGG